MSETGTSSRVVGFVFFDIYRIMENKIPNAHYGSCTKPKSGIQATLRTPLCGKELVKDNNPPGKGSFL